MKNILILCLLSMGMFVSCTDKKPHQNTDDQLTTEQIKEVEQLEQENQNLDQIYNEIENTSKSLDAHLEELDN